MLDDKEHTKRRAQMNNGVSHQTPISLSIFWPLAQYLGKENITLETTIDANIVRFIHLIRTKYLSSGTSLRPMDLASRAQFFTLDTIMDIATGAPMGDLEQDEDIHSYLKTTADALPPLIMMGSVPIVHSFLHIPLVAKRLFPTAEDKIGMGKLIGYVSLVVNWRGC